MSTTNILDLNNRIDALEKNSGGGGTADSAKRSDIATEFNTTTAYTAGCYVYHEGKLYQFNADHAAGAWDPTDVVAANVTDQVVSNASAIAGLTASDIAYDNTDTGLTATETQGAIDEVASDLNNVKDRQNFNNFGTAVNITSYTETEFVAPSDGYLMLAATSSSNTRIRASIYGADDSSGIGLSAAYSQINTFNSVFIKSGMKILITTNENGGVAYFYPIA